LDFWNLVRAKGNWATRLFKAMAETAGNPYVSVGSVVGADGLSWKRRFDDPIPAPKGKPLLTLEDAAAYIIALPKREAAADHWQVAMEQLIDAAEGRNFIMHARIGMLRTLNHGKPDPATTPHRKRAKAYRIVR
jgi:hypothetical protein